jgi:hypothetical protein
VIAPIPCHGTEKWLFSEKKMLYSEYKALKENRAALVTAKANAERILDITPDGQSRQAAAGRAEPERTAKVKKSRDYGAR